MLCFHRLFRLQNPRRWGGKTFIFDFILIFRKHRTPRRSSPDLPDSCQNFKFHFPGGLESGIKIWSHFPLQTACRCKGLESINCEILLSSLFDHHSPRHQHYFHMHLYLNQDFRGQREELRLKKIHVSSSLPSTPLPLSLFLFFTAPLHRWARVLLHDHILPNVSS